MTIGIYKLVGGKVQIIADNMIITIENFWDISTNKFVEGKCKKKQNMQIS
ncbi:unnamed protein product [marine sediment metagenome]|uniref:Uncharacterized protein n=1 Tax=marine sediment metagenome TaxID=412755 RepID=X1AD55_9ZZZZ